MTTETQDGTTVQYHPPVGQPALAPGGPVPPVKPPVRIGQHRATGAKPGTKPIQQAQKKKPGALAEEMEGSRNEGYIAVPTPVEIPKNRDPRLGFTRGAK